jgi:aryl-alcohol dehydrogenase-like predicted oxidoreductase
MAALGRPGYITLGHARDLAGDYAMAAMEGRAHALLDRAWAGGVTYFDAARSYGRAEAFLGSWLSRRRFPAQPPIVGSKWGYIYTAGWQTTAAQHEIKDHTLPVLQSQFEESRQHLQPYLRLYQIHSATFASGVLERRDVLTALAELKTAGLAIGLTLSGPDQADVLNAAQAVIVDGIRLFDTVQATWNILEPSCGPELAAAHAAGMGVIIKEALANGRLTARNSDSAFADQRARLEATALRYGTALDALALAAVLAQPWADVVLSGAATAPQLDSNLNALGLCLEDDDLAGLAGLAEPPVVYWNTRGALPWN